MNTRGGFDGRKKFHVGLATVFPLVVGVCAVPGTMLAAAGHGLSLVPFVLVGWGAVLVGWCAVLLGSAVWLNSVLFNRRQTFFPFLIAIVGMVSIWLWQRQAFIALIPSNGLTYGYFLRAEGAHARFWVLTCPFYVGLGWLVVCCMATITLGWRTGARRSLACIIPWWLAAALVFSLPSMYLDGQGNASIFI